MKFLFRYSIFQFLVLFGFASISAQPCTIQIEGRVVEESTSLPLEYVHVYVEDSENGTITDSSGQFRLSNLCPGSHTLEFSFVGYESLVFIAHVKADSLYIIKLKPKTQLLEEIEVSGVSQNTSPSENTLDERLVEQNSGKNLATIVSRFAGINNLQTGSNIGKPVIHGLHSNRIAMVNDGLIQSGQQWGVDHAPEIEPYFADKITVVKGIGALEYGGYGLGGLVILEPRKPSFYNDWSGDLQYGYQSNGRIQELSGQIFKGGKVLRLRAGLSGNYGGDHRAPDYFLTNTGMRKFSAVASIFFNPNEEWSHEVSYNYFNAQNGILKGSHIGNTTDLEEAIGRTTPFFTEDDFSYDISPPYQKVKHHLWKLSSRYFLNSYSSISVKYGGQLNLRNEYDVRRAGRSELPALSLNQLSQYVGIKYSIDRNKFKTTGGIQFNYVDNTNDPQTGILPFIPDYNKYQTSAFVSTQLELKEYLFEGGLRVDYQILNSALITQALEIQRVKNENLGYSLFLGVSRVQSRWSTGLNLGIVNRPPEPNELYSRGLHQGVASYEFGNPDLKSETGIKGLFSATYTSESDFSMNFEAYVQGIDGYIFLVPLPEPILTIRGAFPVFQYEQEDARIYGFDLSFNYPINSNLAFNGFYSIVRGIERSSKDPLVFMPSDKLRAEFIYNPTNDITSGTLEFSVNGMYVFEQTNILDDQDILPPPDAYFLLGGSIGMKDWLFNNRLSLSFTVENALNTRYRDYLDRLRYYADSDGINLWLKMNLKF